MKIKYLKAGTAVFIILAGIGVLMIVAGAKQENYTAGQKFICFLIGAILIAVSVTPFVIRKRYWKSIQSVQIVDVDSKANLGSAVARGIVGDAIGGAAGAVVAAASAKQDKTTTFLITFKNGAKKTKKVPNDHLDYKRYMRFVG